MILDFDYGRAMNQAMQIDNTASDIEILAKRQFSGVIDNIAVAWGGDAASLYLGKCDELKDEVLKESRKLRELAATLRKVAAIIKETEMKAKQVAETNKIR